jgi:predicted protein tyrosine phosphatase
MSSAIIGREAELGTIHAFLDQTDGPAALVLDGAAGIGKSSALACGCEGCA